MTKQGVIETTTHRYLHLLHESVDVKHCTIASTDYGLVLKNCYLGNEGLGHITRRGRVTEYKPY